jgi:hypothetical protein
MKQAPSERPVRSPSRSERRALVRRGTEDGRVRPIDRAAGAPAEKTRCGRCGAAYERKRWAPVASGETAAPEGFLAGVCPACRQVEAGQYFGRVTLRGPMAPALEEAVLKRIRNVARRAAGRQPERRLVSIERGGADIEVLTTSQKLAHRILRSLLAAFGGEAAYAWSDDDGELHALWIPKENRTATKGAAGAAAEAWAPPGLPRLRVRCRGARLDAAWETRIRRQLRSWAMARPDLTELRVSLTRGRRHRSGGETAAVHAALTGRSVHATKRADTMAIALRDALAAVDREMQPARLRFRRASRGRRAAP